MRLLGQVEHGVYLDSDYEDFSDELEDDMHRYLGVDRPHRRHREPGAGQSEDGSGNSDGDGADWEDDNSSDGEHNGASESDSEAGSGTSATGCSSGSDGRTTVRRTICHQIRHRPVKTPRIQSPFLTQAASNDFKQRLKNSLASEDPRSIPLGYGLRDDEPMEPWDPIELIQIGKKKDAPMVLPEVTWRPRVVTWVKAIVGLTRYLNHLGLEL